MVLRAPNVRSLVKISDVEVVMGEMTTPLFGVSLIDYTDYYKPLTVPNLRLVPEDQD